MNIATVVLLFTTLILTPLPISICGNINLVRREVNLKVVLYGVRLAKQNISFKGTKLQVHGTVNTEIELFNTNFKDGIDFTKCFSVRSMEVVTNCNLCEQNNTKILGAINFASSVGIPLICNFTHKRLSVINKVTFEQSSIDFRLELYTSLIATISALVVQTVKIRKRQKNS